MMAVALDPWTDIVGVGWGTVTHLSVRLDWALDYKVFNDTGGPSSENINPTYNGFGPDCTESEGTVPWAANSTNWLKFFRLLWSSAPITTATPYRPNKGFGGAASIPPLALPSDLPRVFSGPAWKYRAYEGTAGFEQQNFSSRWIEPTGSPIVDTRGNTIPGYVSELSVTLRTRGWKLGEDPHCYTGSGFGATLRMAELLIPAGVSANDFWEHGVTIDDAVINLSEITTTYRDKTFTAVGSTVSSGALSVLLKRSDL